MQLLLLHDKWDAKSKLTWVEEAPALRRSTKAISVGYQKSLAGVCLLTNYWNNRQLQWRGTLSFTGSITLV
jgi:hypothetical protein